MIAYVDSKCSGKKSCEFAVSNLIDVDTPPCSRDVMSYLEATFDCIPGTIQTNTVTTHITVLLGKS